MKKKHHLNAKSAGNSGIHEQCYMHFWESFDEGKGGGGVEIWDYFSPGKNDETIHMGDRWRWEAGT